MDRLFSLLLRLFPAHFRQQYGDGMREVFVDQRRSARARGVWSLITFLARTTTRMTTAAWHERLTSARTPVRIGSATALADLRLTVRSLRRAPGFALTTVLVISVGIGAVVTIAAGVNALVLRPLPGTTRGDELFTIERRSVDMSEGVSVSGAVYRHLRDTTQTLDGLAVWSRVALAVRAGDISLNVPGAIVSHNYFDVLGARPAAGTFFRDGDTSQSIVISHRLWVTSLASSPEAVGRSISVNGRPYTIAGVAPAGFRGVFTPLRLDAWVPLHTQPHVRPGRDLAQTPWLWMFGRLAPHTSTAHSRAELTALLRAWQEAAPTADYAQYSAIRFTPLTGLPDDARQAIFGFSGLLFAGALVVLLIAGANVSSLLAARATTRRHEMGIRAALGAGRLRLVRQLLTETTTLFVAGALGGVGLAWVATSALERLPIPGDGAIVLELSPDWRVVVLALLLGLISSLVVGLAPALRGTSREPSTVLRASTAGAGTRRSRLNSVLLVGQLAGSLVLLTVTTLLISAVTRGERMNLGFDPAGIATVTLNTEAFGYTTSEGEAFYRALERRLRDSPEVSAVAVAQVAPLVAVPSGTTLTLPGEGEGTRLPVKMQIVGPGFFDVLGTRVLAGRAFGDIDVRGGTLAAVINTTLARRAWPDTADVVGRWFDRGTRRYTVVGVVDDIVWGSLDEGPLPMLYVSMTQQWLPNQTLFLKMTTPVAAERIVADVVRTLDARVPAPLTSTLAQDITVAVFPQRVAAAVTSVLASGALLLACTGLYGALAYLVSSRSREIGIRMALGASRGQVMALIARSGLRIAGAGIVIGLAGALAAVPLTSSLLLGGNVFDVPTFVAAALVLLVVSLVATMIPARRATTVDPVKILR